ncbi:MAG: SDR family oxidoreductase [Alphaproteobacteria bacterium]|nr:SDR family oxidoreductase [Alphaproteobacteria bacterium]
MSDQDPTAFSRRTIVGGVAMGLAAAAAGSAVAQERNPQMTGHLASEPNMDDPRTKYPKPPFKKQTQPWPGLVRDMDPKPDHGETSYRGSGRLTGRKALITGGDSGMGRAAAIAYAREGADVAINYFPSEEPDAREVIHHIRNAGRKAVAIPGDLREEAFCQKLVSDAVQNLGGLDIVVCNAGRQQSKPSILDITSEDFDATMKTNIYAPFWIIKAALPHLKPGSCIIGTTSEQAYDPSPDLYDYAQTKAATMNYVKSLAKQLGPKGIRVNGVAPGPVWTPLQISGGATEKKYENFGNTTVFGRPGQPVELASIYVQLAAADGSFATGNVYGSGGGQGQP